MKKNKYSTPLWMLATILAGMLPYAISGEWSIRSLVTGW